MKGTGVVRWFNDRKGFGFIKASDGGEDIFVHFSVIDVDGFKTINKGDLVEYELQEGDTGRHASKVVVL